MTPYASVALFGRNGDVLFSPPHKERPTNITQARKAAARFWRSNLTAGDTLGSVILVREFAGQMEISERAAGSNRPWLEFTREIAEARQEPHLAACLDVLRVGPGRAEVPDVLEINGVIYRRDI
ncbi:MAG: hypothetical protein KJZ80_16145 [Hyphomicrobiaceae bacterium]|nr:hypothetical protein [Hyphomicrobiaceae bacterium]